MSFKSDVFRRQFLSAAGRIPAALCKDLRVPRLGIRQPGAQAMGYLTDLQWVVPAIV